MRYLLLIVLCLIPFLAACQNQPGLSATTSPTAPPTTAATDATRITIASLMALETNPTPKVTRTDAQWKSLLPPLQYAVLRQKDTEAPFSGQYDEFFQSGTYVCAACGQPLFSSQNKFDSGTGWPSFYQPLARNDITLQQDDSLGMTRTEVLCSNCGSHLGHLFDDAPQTPTGLRYCMNSVSLKFIAQSSAAK